MNDARTRLYGVFGRPVGHSMSPVMHNAAFSHIRYNGAYLAFEVADIGEAVRAVRTLSMGGASITLPHKVAVIPFLDGLTPLAAAIGAVNTVVNHDGVLTGDNSDAPGAVAALKEKTDLCGKSVALIGAGGAARAIGFGVRKEGAQVTVISRSEEKGRRLAEALEADVCLTDRMKSRSWDILVNATPVGMAPDIHEMPVDESVLSPSLVVMDAVYTPLKTRLIMTARKKGCRTVSGLRMFIHQGACQFECWTGRKAPVMVMEEAVLAAMGETDD